MRYYGEKSHAKHTENSMSPPPQPSISADQEIVEIYRAASFAEAHAIRLAVEQAGIACVVDGEDLQGALGELPMGWATSPRLLVKSSDAIAARKLIDAAEVGPHESGKQSGAATSDSSEAAEETLACLACGKPMSATTDRCSCGWTYRDDAAAR